MGKGVEEKSRERDKETKGGKGGGGGRRGEEEGGERRKEGRGGMWKGEGELPVSVVVAVYCPDWLLLIASTVVHYFPDAAWGGKGCQSTNGLKDFL